MHIVLIDRTFHLPEEEPDEDDPDYYLYRAGRTMVDEGHQVTILSGDAARPAAAGGGWITLRQREGLVWLRYTPHLFFYGFGSGHISCSNPGSRNSSIPVHRFTRWATGQVKNLPRAGLILVVVSCLADCRPVLPLRRSERVPLVLAVRRPLAPAVRTAEGTKAAGRRWQPFPAYTLHLARRTYREAEAVIALNEASAREAQDLAVAGKRLFCPAADGSGTILPEQYSALLRSYTVKK